MMKQQKHNTITFNWLMIFLFSILVFSCNSVKKQKAEAVNDRSKAINSMQQNDEDLLNGTASAISYSGFRTGQHPDRGEGAINPTDSQILEDLQMMSKDSLFNLIRLYDSGENSESVLRIIEENHLDIKVMLGMWLKAELSAHETCAWLTEPIAQNVLDQNRLLNHQEIEKGIQLATKYDKIVVAVNVGNEALVDWNDHKVDTDTIISYVKKVQKTILQPVTVADNYDWWAVYGEKLAKAVDFISIHVYPIWEGKDIDEAMSYTIENVQKVHNALPDSKIVISEAGWASEASEFGERASEDKQLLYYTELMKWSKEMNITTFFFEAFDEDWKGETANPLGAEKHWGLFTVDRKPKLVMQK